MVERGSRRTILHLFAKLNLSIALLRRCIQHLDIDTLLTQNCMVLQAELAAVVELARDAHGGLEHLG